MLKKCTIKIPSGYRYLGDVPGFKFETGILAKQLTGCGATSLALRDKTQNTVVYVPRI